MSDLAQATLPVAIALAIFTAAAWMVLWAQVDDLRARRVARQYLEPLSTWCLIVVATHVLALGASGDAGVMSLVLPLVLAAAAVLLRSVGEEGEPAPKVTPAEAKPAPKPAPVPAEPDPRRAAPAPAPAASLWANPTDEPTTRRGTLWSR